MSDPVKWNMMYKQGDKAVLVREEDLAVFNFNNPGFELVEPRSQWYSTVTMLVVGNYIAETDSIDKW
ncbi:hypothetical protein [Ralstonia phage RP13]|nr:hypothetical protein [Ralstonia phage RP13]BCG50293.1 hypothetical protein [Ralstonia phage RP13]